MHKTQLIPLTVLGLALAACGGDSHEARTADDAEASQRAADHADDAAERASDKAEKAEDKADAAADQAEKAEDAK